ncbi:hypothetical protein WMF04_10705 [Sorangium sp. So ce260]|uniref:hypothetical protein n=1 Tax=Sorangium sp. So ce260 TaxID=3133291 RepID=UPI003F601ED4
MKRAMNLIASSLVSSFALVGCVADATDLDAELAGLEEVEEAAQALCVDMAALPAFDQTAIQSNSSDVGSFTLRESPDNTYYSSKGNYVVEVTNVKNPFASSQTATAYSVNAYKSKSICENTTTTATLYGFDEVEGCWVQIGATKTKKGVYSPGGGFIQPSCSDGVSWSIPTTVTKVRIKGKSVLQTMFGPAGQKIAEGTSWIH